MLEIAEAMSDPFEILDFTVERFDGAILQTGIIDLTVSYFSDHDK